MSKHRAAVVALAVGTGLAACSSGSDSGTSAASSAATSSGADVCDSAGDLRTSLAALGDVQVVQEGTGGLEAAWATVQDDWAQFADAARARYSAQVDTVQAEADAVGQAVDAAQSTPSAGTLGTAATAVGAFVKSAGDLVDEAGSNC
jgi:ABC-type glycerol-3-phosphate transport system substrate-binding protein